MNYPLSSPGTRELAAVIFRAVIILLLVFFTGYFVVEALTFIRLFEVTVVANPAMYLVK